MTLVEKFVEHFSLSGREFNVPTGKPTRHFAHEIYQLIRSKLAIAPEFMHEIHILLISSAVHTVTKLKRRDSNFLNAKIWLNKPQRLG